MKVIIVDDEYFARLALIKSIDWSAYGFEVIAEAENGKEAYRLIVEMKPDLVILDINMPFVNGLELLEKTTENELNTKFILLSGYSEFEYAKEAIKYGVESYLLKPLIEQELHDELKRISLEINEEKKLHEIDAQYLKIAQKDYIRKLFTGQLKDTTENLLPDFEHQFCEYMRVVCLSIRLDKKIMTHKIETIINQLNMKFRNDMNIVYCRLENEIGLIISSAEEAFLNDDRVEKMFLQVYESLNELEELHRCTVGISDIYTALELTSDEFRVAKLYSLESNDVKLAKHGEMGKIKLSDLIKVFVVENLSNTEFTISDVARKFCFSYDYICRIFKKNEGISLGDYIIKVRMEEARRLLVNEAVKTSELSIKCGYSDTGYFSKVFKRYFGMTPRVMRKINNGE